MSKSNGNKVATYAKGEIHKDLVWFVDIKINRTGVITRGFTYKCPADNQKPLKVNDVFNLLQYLADNKLKIHESAFHAPNWAEWKAYYATKVEGVGMWCEASDLLTYAKTCKTVLFQKSKLKGQPWQILLDFVPKESSSSSSQVIESPDSF